MADFGSNKQKWVVKKNALAKRLQGGFLLQTTVAEDEVWSSIRSAAAEFPQRKSFLKRGGMGVLQLKKQKDIDLFGWGALNKADEVVDVDWALGVRPVSGGFHLYLAHGKAISGKVEGATEMEGFLGILEARLSDIDPGTSIDFVNP